MPASFFFGEHNGAATAHPTIGGTTRATGQTNVNWKNVDDTSTAYSASPISAGSNGFTKYQFGCFTGTFNQISSVKFQHVSGTFGAGLTLKGLVSGLYATPATTANASLIHDITPTGDIATGLAMLLGTAAQGPFVTGSAASTTLTVPGYTQYFATQLQTTVAASAGDTSTCTFQIQYSEN